MGDLFEVGTVKSFDEGKLILEKQKCNNLIEFVGRTRSNNGIKGYVAKLETEPNPANVISISQIGTIVAQIRNKKWYASQNIFSLSPKNSYKSLISLFGVSTINKGLNGSFSDGYGNYPTLDKLKTLTINLPTKNGEIDFEFMESFIRELEADRISRLNQYLVSTGLNNYVLTTDEQQALTSFEDGKVNWGEFSYKNIFNKIVQGRRLKKEDQTTGDIPFIMAGTTNMGVVNYISNPVASFPKNSITVDIFGNTFYRNYDYGAGDDTGVYWNNEKTFAKTSMLFLATAISKSISGKFNYGTKLRSSQSLDFKMSLPIKNNKPDYVLMEMLISAVQKTVIKGVVEYVQAKSF